MIMTQHCDNISNLLWTGGWDSTFRLLLLLLKYNQTVQPYYVIDSDRLSTGLELRTMKNIKTLLFEKYPQTKDLLLPTIFKDLFDIKPNQELTKRFERIIEHTYMGSQYDWLSRYCCEAGIQEMELSIHRDDKAHEVLEEYVCEYSEEKNACFKIDEKFKGSDEYELFRYFRFPIFNWTKLEIQSFCKNDSLNQFMDLTWFCHKPKGNSKPCGVCNPCTYTIEEGLGRRIPFSSRMSYHFQIKRKIKKNLLRYPVFYALLRGIKQRLLSPKNN